MQTRQHLEPRNVCGVQHLPPLRVRVVRWHGDDDIGVGAANLPGEGRKRSRKKAEGWLTCRHCF